MLDRVKSFPKIFKTNLDFFPCDYKRTCLLQLRKDKVVGLGEVQAFFLLISLSLSFFFFFFDQENTK